MDCYISSCCWCCEWPAACVYKYVTSAQIFSSLTCVHHLNFVSTCKSRDQPTVELTWPTLRYSNKIYLIFQNNGGCVGRLGFVIIHRMLSSVAVATHVHTDTHTRTHTGEMPRFVAAATTADTPVARQGGAGGIKNGSRPSAVLLLLLQRPGSTTQKRGGGETATATGATNKQGWWLLPPATTTCSRTATSLPSAQISLALKLMCRQSTETSQRNFQI